MTKHGTTPNITGSYVEFQAAVLRALPRNIDPDVALGWTQNGESLARVLKAALVPYEKKFSGELFLVTCDGSYKASELAAMGKYQSNHQITDELFPIKERMERVIRVIELIEFHYSPTSENVFAEFARRGLEQPTYEDALYFGVQYPEEQRKRPIVFLHEPVFPNKNNSRFCVVLVLDKAVDDRRGIYLNWFFNSNKWNSFYTFAAIRKNG